MSRTYAQADCFDAMQNPKRMHREDIACFQQQFNVNLNCEDEGDDWFDGGSEEIELTEISDDEFIQAYVLNDDWQ